MPKHTGTHTIRAIDLFCGAGGSSWGARSAGVDVVAAFDKWDLAGEVYSANFPNAQFHAGRLEDVDAATIASELGKIDLILASPECTNHSPAKGGGKRCEQSKATAFQVVRFVEALRPRWVVIENVVSMRRWTRYREFTERLTALGYHLREQVLNAVDFGVPQRRRRLFILGDRERQPAATPKPARIPRLAARQFVSLNGEYAWTPLATERRAKATMERAERARNHVGANRPFLLVYYGSDHAGGWQRLTRPLRTITTLDRFAVVKRQNGKDVMRMLQPPELKAAMGMQGMTFNHGTRRDRIRMIGNAVCPRVMAQVVKTLIANTQSKE